jgi:hypothetical protein
VTVTESTAAGICSGADAGRPGTAETRHRFDVGVLGGLASALIGLGLGATRIADNSFLTHLATGREMLAGGGVGFVREDVFTWTSGGRGVVVQSWAASLLYGLVDEVAGFHGLRLLTAVLAALLAAMVWRLTRSSASIGTRVIIMAPVFVIGYVTWTERPLLIAFVLFAGVMLVVEGDGRPGWLAVAGALWVNVHGSWPLGIAYLVARAVGATIDREDGTRERTALGFLGAGMLVGGVVNPYGPAMLWFPVELLGRQEVLTHVVEWQSPSFDSTWTRAFLVMVAAAVVALMRRPRWRDALPVLLFLAAALVGRRNIALSALVMVPVLARGLPAIGRLTARHTSDAVRLGVIALGGLLVAVPTVAMRGPHVDVDRFPVAAVTAMEDELGLVPGETRIIHQDFVGNYLDLRYGDARASWIDDRFELHDPELIEDYLTLLDGGPTWADVLERYDAEAILWPTDRVLVTLARDVGGWTDAWHDESWTVLCAPGATSCSPVGDPESLAEG